MIVLLVLIDLTSCTTTEGLQEPDTFRDTIIFMIPALPEVPSLPELTWTYQNGLYCLDEQNVDKLLDYGENTLPLFRWELKQYQRKLDSILQAL